MSSNNNTVIYSNNDQNAVAHAKARALLAGHTVNRAYQALIVFTNALLADKDVHDAYYAMLKFIVDTNQSAVVPSTFAENYQMIAALTALKKAFHCWSHSHQIATRAAVEAVGTARTASDNCVGNAVAKAQAYEAVIKELNPIERGPLINLDHWVIPLAYTHLLLDKFTTSDSDAKERVTVAAWTWLFKLAIRILCKESKENLKSSTFDDVISSTEYHYIKDNFINNESNADAVPAAFANHNAINISQQQTPSFIFATTAFPEPHVYRASAAQSSSANSCSNTSSGRNANTSNNTNSYDSSSMHPKNYGKAATGAAAGGTHKKSDFSTPNRGCAKCAKYISFEGSQDKIKGAAGANTDEWSQLVTNSSKHGTAGCFRFLGVNPDQMTVDNVPLVGPVFTQALNQGTAIKNALLKNRHGNNFKKR